MKQPEMWGELWDGEVIAMFVAFVSDLQCLQCLHPWFLSQMFDMFAMFGVFDLIHPVCTVFPVREHPRSAPRHIVPLE